eukprot:jgi/Tetstr1/456256/TSEL_043017.t1
MGSEYGGSRSGRSHSMLGPIDQGSHRSQDTLPSGSGMMGRAFSIQHDGDQQGFDTPGSSEVSRPSGGNLRGRDVSSQLPTGASSAPDPTPMRLLAGAPKKSLSRTRRRLVLLAVGVLLALLLPWAHLRSRHRQSSGAREDPTAARLREAKSTLYQITQQRNRAGLATSPRRIAVKFLTQRLPYQCPKLNTTLPVIPLELQQRQRNEYGYPRRQRRYSWEQFPKIVRGEGFQFTLCTIPKNGCSQWKRMIAKAMKFPPEFYLDEKTSHLTIHGTKYKYLPYSTKPKLLAALAAPHVVISRDPFTRVLSAYLNKIVKATERRRYRRKLGLDEWSDWVTFEDYVRALRAWADREPQGLKLSSGIDHHWALQTSFCGLPNDSTSSLHHDWVLKMEEINDWYTCFVSAMNITSIVETGWPDNKCFFSAPDNPCDGQRMEDGFTGTQWDATGHKTRSSSKADEYYTEYLVKEVAELYADDFEFFGYPSTMTLMKTNGTSAAP